MQEFLLQNVDAVGAVNKAPPRAALDDAVNGLEAQSATQRAATTYATSQTTLKEAAREDLRVHHMGPIAAIARANLAGTPQISTLRLPGKRVSDGKLIADGTAMGQNAALYTQVFLDHQLPADFLTQLQAAVDAVKKTVAARNAALQNAKAATEQVAVQVTGARNTVKILNALVVKQLKGQANLLASWKMAKQINAKPGVPRGTTKPVVVPATTPPAAPAPASAAVPVGATVAQPAEVKAA